MIPLEQWPDTIESVLERECKVLTRLTLLRETSSTQDAARAAGARIGTVVAAWRQARGRGRLGREWLDTGLEGVAVTFVVPRMEPERLSVLSAVAAAEAVATCGGAAASVGIKWPNDLTLQGRKLGGVLVEQGTRDALVGIGINVRQASFPHPVSAIAISLHQAGVQVDRLDVLCELIREMDRWIAAPVQDTYRTYRARDQLTGRVGIFQTPEGLVEGTVIAVDPSRGLVVSASGGERFLPTATTSVVPPTP
jgi:BirA family biotin operon repressor/biotin-[acetyl-CoA-carboxylase] ligase